MNESIHNTAVPDFSAESTVRPFRLSDYKGRKLIIYFYPKDNTPGCTSESISFRDNYEAFQEAGAAIVGVSRDSLKSHENFSRKLGLPFPLVSDPDETICNLFNVMKDKKRYGRVTKGIERSTFLIDEQGSIIKEWRGVKVAGHVDEVLKTVQALKK